jgi:transketolase
VDIKPRAMRDALLEQIWQAMATDNRLFFVSADFGSPVLDKIRADHPERFVNVGIAEQNLINVSAGLALEGFKVFAYAIAPFITMRCFEQIRVSLGLLSKLRNMNVNLVGVGAGYSYVMSGPTHQCYEDISLMRTLPGFGFYSPADHVAATGLFRHCVDNDGPKYLRFDAQVLPVIYQDRQPDILNGFDVHKQGDRVCLVATGFMLHTALKVAEKFHAAGHAVGVIDLFDLAGFDPGKLLETLSPYDHVATLEEGFIARGGLDSLMFDFLNRRAPHIRLKNFGINNTYSFDLGGRNDLHEQVGISPEAVFRELQPYFDNNLRETAVKS